MGVGSEYPAVLMALSKVGERPNSSKFSMCSLASLSQGLVSARCSNPVDRTNTGGYYNDNCNYIVPFLANYVESR